MPATDKSIPQAVVSASGYVYKLTSQGGRINRVVMTSDASQLKLAQGQFAGDDKSVVPGQK